MAGVGVGGGFGDVEEGVRIWSQWEGSTGTWHKSWGNRHRGMGTDVGDVAQGEDRGK